MLTIDKMNGDEYVRMTRKHSNRCAFTDQALREIRKFWIDRANAKGDDVYLQFSPYFERFYFSEYASINESNEDPHRPKFLLAILENTVLFSRI